MEEVTAKTDDTAEEDVVPEDDSAVTQSEEDITIEDDETADSTVASVDEESVNSVDVTETVD